MKERKRRKTKRIYRKWHSFIGMLLVIPLLFLTATGLLLNHSQDLKLDQKRVRSEWVMHQYGLTFADQPTCFTLPNNRLAASWEGQLILDGKAVTEGDTLIGACDLTSGTALATESHVHYLSPQGEMIETLDELVLPSTTLSQIGTTPEGRLVVRTEKGDWSFDADLVEATPLSSDASVRWATSTEGSAEQLQSLKSAIIGDGMPLDRVLLDLHSGNLFKTVGKIIVDLVGLAIFAVSISGVIVFFRAKKRRKKEVPHEG